MKHDMKNSINNSFTFMDNGYRLLYIYILDPHYTYVNSVYLFAQHTYLWTILVRLEVNSQFQYRL